MVTTSLLRSLIRETLLLEEVYGAQAVVYHGTEADPLKLVSALLNDEFVPGKGAGSMYGKGLYTVYDINGTPTESGNYGNGIIKLKLNLYGYIIFDPDVALKVYKAPLSIVEQAQELGLDEEIIEKLRGVKIDTSNFTSVAAEFASKFLKGQVKGLVYTGARDGRCALVYDPTTAVPISWKNVRDKSWTRVDSESIKPSLRRSASGDWQKEKYETDFLKVLKKLESYPLDQRVIKGDLDLSFTPITSLPSGLKVIGNLSLSDAPITSLPAGLKVGGNFNLYGTEITSLPAELRVGGDLNLSRTPIKSLPNGLRVGGDLNLSDTPIASLPDGLKVGGDLNLIYTSITFLPAGLKVGGNLSLTATLIKSLPADLHVSGNLSLSDTPITSLPAGLKVDGHLNLDGTTITSLPADLKVGGNLNLYGTPIKSFPDGLQVGKSIRGFDGDKALIPSHLRNKL